MKRLWLAILMGLVGCGAVSEPVSDDEVENEISAAIYALLDWCPGEMDCRNYELEPVIACTPDNDPLATGGGTPLWFLTTHQAWRWRSHLCNYCEAIEQGLVFCQLQVDWYIEYCRSCVILSTFDVYSQPSSAISAGNQAN
jgi:hypothetical protein